MKTEQMKLKSVIFEDLKNALDNEYSIVFDARVKDLAMDLIHYEPEVSALLPSVNEIIPHIEKF